MRLSEFDYPFQDSLIAQEPHPDREGSRLLVFHRQKQTLEHRVFRDILDYLKPGDLLVLNDTKVFPARLYGRKRSTGKVVECLLVSEMENGGWEGMVRGKVQPGEIIEFGRGWVGSVEGVNHGNGRRRIRFSGEGDVSRFMSAEGAIPLPPYIKRLPREMDLQRYQTVYARHEGSIAAPTAGLHFSRTLLGEIQERGIQVTAVTLHIGPGTFQPIRTEPVEAHPMERETYSVSKEALERLSRTRKAGGRIVGVGTSSTRVLESLPDPLPEGDVHGNTGLFIFPGHRFRYLDGFVTNFHLPKSTPYVLTAAFAGLGALREIYKEATEKAYRFYSYGDAMLIL